jgi:hypothetical protein
MKVEGVVGSRERVVGSRERSRMRPCHARMLAMLVVALSHAVLSRAYAGNAGSTSTPTAGSGIEGSGMRSCVTLARTHAASSDSHNTL